ncbi:MAG: glycosyltransferase, partial [Gammaproteobacteria bacterium]|nr:glycosyltransferase [Gammaproteobacteria bacterium]
KNAKTANLALWRSDFIAVNGFDESFTGWGYEDSDLLTRLLKINVHRRIGAYSTFIFHLHHEIRSRDQASSNWNRLQDQMASARILATLGVDQYLPPRPSIGVAMIVKNEAHRLDRSLRSAQFADQISVVVDESTTDDSIGIAKKYTSLVISSPWLGFGAQKNLAISKLATDWILLLDADEVISPALATEILSVIRDQKQAYFLMRHSYYLNQAIHYGDAKNDRVLRLFPRGEGHVEDTLVHEKVISTLPTATLLNPLFHYTIDRIEEFQAKCESYSTLGAQKAFQSGKSANFVSMWTHSIGCFVRGYFFRGGFLDGKTGFLIAYFNAYGTFLKYQKLIKLGKAR